MIKNRIISCVCAISLFFCLVAFTASAETYQSHVYSFLQAPEYKVYTADGSYNRYLDVPHSTYRGTQAINFYFSTSWNGYLQYAVLDVIAQTGGISLSVIGDDGTIKSASLVGSKELDANYSLYQFWIGWNKTCPDGMLLTFTNSTGITQDITLSSFRGYSNQYISLDNFDFSQDLYFIDNLADGKIHNLSHADNVSVGYVNSTFYTAADLAWGNFLYGVEYITIQPADLEFYYIDELILNLRVNGNISNVGISLLDKTTGDVSVLLDENYFSVFSEESHIFTQDQQYLVDYSIIADLSGYDLNSFDIQVSYLHDGLASGATNNRAFYSEVLSLGFTYPIDDIPWYVKLWGSVRNGFSSLGDSISSGFSSVGSLFTNIQTAMQNGFNSVVELLDMMVNGDQDAADQFEQQGQQAQDSLDQASDVLGSVQKPDITPDNLFDQYLNYNTIGLSILSMMTSNSYITDMLVLVFTFALAGFIFYGKKG